jgi:Flp pilus assembly protein TadG
VQSDNQLLFKYCYLAAKLGEYTRVGYFCFGLLSGSNRSRDDVFPGYRRFTAQLRYTASLKSAGYSVLGDHHMHKSRNGQRGSAFFMIMFMALPMFAAVGLVVDIGWAYYTRQAAHSAAEAAAMAAAQSALDGIKAGGTYTCGSQGLGCYTSTAYTCPATTPSPITSNVQNGCAYAAANGFTNGGPNGQAVTMLANTSSPFNGVSVKYWVTAQILQQNPLTFGAVLGGQIMNVGAHATAAVFLSVPQNCVIALDPSAHGAVTVQGGADVNVSCGVASNSSASDALAVNGKVSVLNASSIQVVGDYTGVGTINPTPVTGGAAAADPYANLQRPTPSTPCTADPSISGGTVSLNPGTYCGITISGNADVTFNPGTFILLGGGFHAGSSNTILTGTGVTFYNTCSTSPCNGGSAGYQPISIDGNLTATLSAPTSGSYQGILFYQDPTVQTTSTDQITGNSALRLTGALYFPKSELKFAGGSSSGGSTMIVADKVTFSGGVSYLGDSVTNAGSASAPKVALLE